MLATRVGGALGVVLAVVSALLAPGVVAPADAATTHCVGYDDCAARGLSHGGYAAANQSSYWNMVTGHNCTNYAAFRVIQRGGPGSRPWAGSGDANRWGHELSGSTDQTPIVGAIAWWDSFTGGWGENGHVAYVERVLSASTIQISEDIYNGDFRWRTISRGEAAWPTGFIHLVDERVRSRAEPRISGAPRVGETLRTSDGAWEPEAVEVHYQWSADGRPIRGATRPSLELSPGLVGTAVRVQVTAHRLGYLPASTTTAATAPIRPGRIRPRREPRILGRALVGEELVADPGRTRPEARASYRWLADGKPLRGATSSRLLLEPKHVGDRIAVQITWRHRGYEATQRTARMSGRVARALLKRVTSPRITGDLQVGGTAVAVPARWSVTPTKVAYVWFADDQVIEGVYGPRLDLGPELAGRMLTVVEGASRRGYAPGVSASVRVGPVS